MYICRERERERERDREPVFVCIFLILSFQIVLSMLISGQNRLINCHKLIGSLVLCADLGLLSVGVYITKAT